MTRKPRFWIMCCWTVGEDSTNSQINSSSLELKEQVKVLWGGNPKFFINFL